MVQIAMTYPPPEVIKFLSKIGKKTRGRKIPNRKRGDSEHYRKMSRKRWDKKEEAK